MCSVLCVFSAFERTLLVSFTVSYRTQARHDTKIFVQFSQRTSVASRPLEHGNICSSSFVFTFLDFLTCLELFTTGKCCYMKTIKF